VDETCVVASWPSVPVEIVRAAGLCPVMIRGTSGPTPAADAHLEPGIFPSRLRRLVDDALTGRLPHAARIVIPRTSDADYKCFLYLRELVRRGVPTALAPVVLFDLLQSRGPDVPAYDVARIHALLDELSLASGRTPSDDDLRNEIARANAARAAARRLVELRRPVPRVVGAEVFPLLAAFWEMNPDPYAEMASDAAKRIAARPPLAGPRVLLTGAPVDRHTLHETIESHGAVVIDEVGPWGSGAAGEDVPIDGDPVAALADKYRADSIGARTPVDALRRWTHSRLDEVDAVVVSLPPDDAVFGWDYPALRDVLNARRIPHVCLRGDPYEPPTPADRAAFDAMVSAASRLQEARHG
jgi:benzoyl-CoA reductase/2-hydroxyglutaryl-CoA dehydratase subunit BcrC/BadD/HgdB